jgi:NUMOD4 motif
MKDIPGFEGLYQITDDGKVWSLPKQWTSGFNGNFSHDGQWITPQKHSGGYLQVVLTRDARSRMHYVHRLVAQTYIPNPLDLPEVNHKDGNKKNNHYSMSSGMGTSSLVYSGVPEKEPAPHCARLAVRNAPCGASRWLAA